MKTKFFIMAIAALFMLCGCGKSESKKMSKAEIKERIIEHYTQYGLPKDYIEYRLGERSSWSGSNTSILLILQKRNQLDLMDYLDKDVEIYMQAE